MCPRNPLTAPRISQPIVETQKNIPDALGILTLGHSTDDDVLMIELVDENSFTAEPND